MGAGVSKMAWLLASSNPNLNMGTVRQPLSSAIFVEKMKKVDHKSWDLNLFMTDLNGCSNAANAIRKK